MHVVALAKGRGVYVQACGIWPRFISKYKLYLHSFVFNLGRPKKRKLLGIKTNSLVILDTNLLVGKYYTNTFVCDILIEGESKLYLLSFS